MKITTLLISYGFRFKENTNIIADGSGSGSIVFKYLGAEDYASSYDLSYTAFIDQLKNDFLSKYPKELNDLQMELIYFNCLHSLTEELGTNHPVNTQESESPTQPDHHS